MLKQNRYAQLARQAAREGAVLLKNDRETLPLKHGCRVASFGRSQFHYYKSGTGSGGLVNSPYVIGILDAMLGCTDITVNEDVLRVYTDWVREHPFDEGHGWATEPWCQEEMPLSEELVRAAAEDSDVAVISIGRTAGEDKDNSAYPGSYLLLPEEEKMLELVCRHFEKTVVLLNVGNIIDMKWVARYDPAAVLYVWHGGQEGGNGVLDLLLGVECPSGKLPDTIAGDISDYPSTENFGDDNRNIYREDIYVGYRYFETFRKNQVLYPFGFGLSYTSFEKTVMGFEWDGERLSVDVNVTNTGAYAGREVVQLYVSVPQGALGKPERVLCAFGKTGLLPSGAAENIHLSCGLGELASFDDSGASGYAHAWVLEAGAYVFFLGGDVRSAERIGAVTLQETVRYQQLSEAMSPVIPFQRMCRGADGELSAEQAPMRSYDLWQRIQENRPQDIPITGDRGIQLEDVRSGKASMEEFVAQIPVEQLCVILRGEGMSSPKVTPGTGGAYGGVSDALKKLGIPIGCCTDGPGGIRMDTGELAMSIPNGVCLSSTFNTGLMEDLFEQMGLELRKNRVDILLGPGMNLHRNPLNGRNFEYFSEDPLLGGKIAAAQLRGMHRRGVTGSIKHFVANNQEHRRHFVDSVVSQRALRELYLKSFEIAVKEGGAYCVMSTYGAVNGLFTASNYDLLTRILREEWGFRGVVMSDWWAKGNEEGTPGEGWEVAAMVRSQNDLYMVTEDAVANTRQDNLEVSAGTDKLTIGEMQRCAMNLLQVLMDSPAMDRLHGREEAGYAALWETRRNAKSAGTAIRWDMRQGGVIPVSQFGKEDVNREILLENLTPGVVTLELRLHAETVSELAQLPMYVYVDDNLAGSICITGRDRDVVTHDISLGRWEHQNMKLRLYSREKGIILDECLVKIRR